MVVRLRALSRASVVVGSLRDDFKHEYFLNGNKLKERRKTHDHMKKNALLSRVNIPMYLLLVKYLVWKIDSFK